MNTQGGALATMELVEYSTLLHHAPFDPESCVMLSLDGTAVTRRLETTIRTTASLPALITYYQESFHWNQRTFYVVDWDTFGSVYPKMHKRRNFITKLCFYHLPTSDRLHRRDPCYDDRCPTCHTPNNKTDDHLFQCASPARRAWQSNLIRSILKPIDAFLDPILLDILQENPSASFVKNQWTHRHIPLDINASLNNNFPSAGTISSAVNSLKNGSTSSNSTAFVTTER